MSSLPLMNPEKLTGLAGYVDAPADGALHYAECLPVAGWLHAPGRAPQGCRIRGWIEGELIGETAMLFVRADVCAALQLPETIATGFRFLGKTSRSDASAREVELLVTASWIGATEEYEVARVPLRLLSAGLAQRPYGGHIHPEQARVLGREQIYGSGPPVTEPGAETLMLLQQYLTARSPVVDVGCGAGAYALPLIAEGHQWVGLEVNASCLEILAKRGLPHRQVPEPSAPFPCADREFEGAICVEVLEHIGEPDRFLSEINRVIGQRALFSVPNIEVIPYFSAWQVVPWHLLEADHKNFFTRASLRALLERHFARVEVFSYAEHPLRMPEGVPLHLHLFAIAEKRAS